MVNRSFMRGRGRPKEHRPALDNGTPELANKRASGLTYEALDDLLRREIITEPQHWCGMHLRWLFTLQFGAPTVSAVDPERLHGRSTREDNPRWRKARERELREVLAMLAEAGLDRIMLRICVYHEAPHCLRPPRGALSAAQRYARELEYQQVLCGFMRLADHWRR